MQNLKKYRPHYKHLLAVLSITLFGALALSLIPVTSSEIKNTNDSRLGLGVVYEKTGKQPDYITPQFKLFSAEGETTEVFFGGDVKPTCLDYPDLILPEADHGRPFAVFEVRDNPYCNLSVFFAPVGFGLNYVVALALIGPTWLIIARKLKR